MSGRKIPVQSTNHKAVGAGDPMGTSAIVRTTRGVSGWKNAVQSTNHGERVTGNPLMVSSMQPGKACIVKEMPNLLMTEIINKDDSDDDIRDDTYTCK